MTYPTPIALIRAQPYFRALPEEVLQPLYQKAQLRSFLAGEIIFQEGDAPEGLFIVQTGSVKLFRLATTGRETIISIVYPEESFNEVAVWDGLGNPVSAVALSDAQLVLLPIGIVRGQMERYPELMRAVLESMSRRMRKVVAKVAEMAAYRLLHRLAKLLLELPPEQLHGPQRLSQNDMAALLGTVREVLSRSLKELQEQGAIRIQRGDIVITDRRFLEKLASLCG